MKRWSIVSVRGAYDSSAEGTGVIDSPEGAEQGFVANKKSRVALIVAVAVVWVVIVACVVWATMVLVNYTSADNVVMKAVVNALDQKAARMNGELTIRGEAIEYAGIKSIVLRSASESAVVPAAGEAVLTIETVSDEVFEGAFDGVIMRDAVLYFRADGLNEILQEAKAQAVVDEIDETLLSYYEDFVDEVDGSWWKIDLEEIWDGKREVESYRCMVDVLATANEEQARREVIELYEEWPLLDAEKLEGVRDNGANGYSIEFDPEGIAGFINGFRNTELFDQMFACARMEISDLEVPEDVDADEFEVPEDFPDIVVYVHDWSHELESLEISYENDDILVEGRMEFEFMDEVDIEAPDDARSVTVLFEKAKQIVCYSLRSFISDCDAFWGQYEGLLEESESDDSPVMIGGGPELGCHLQGDGSVLCVD